MLRTKGTERARMMGDQYKIDVGADEELIAVSGELPRFVQTLVGGKRVHNSTAYRWALQGVRGRRLPTVRIASRLYTSKAAFAWWAAKLADDLIEVGEPAVQEPPSTAINRVEEVLRRAGIRD